MIIKSYEYEISLYIYIYISFQIYIEYFNFKICIESFITIINYYENFNINGLICLLQQIYKC